MPSPWVREEARGRAATAGMRGGAVAAAVGAGELLPRPHRLTGVAQPQQNAFAGEFPAAAVFQLQMHAHACVCAASTWTGGATSVKKLKQMGYGLGMDHKQR